MAERLKINDLIINNLEDIITTICEDEVETISEKQYNQVLSTIKSNKCIEVEKKGDMFMESDFIVAVGVVIAALQLICMYFNLHYTPKKQDIDYVGEFLNDPKNSKEIDEETRTILTRRKEKFNSILARIISKNK